MIDDRELLEAVCQKYIRPTEREAKPVVGVELEYPIVNLNGIGWAGPGCRGSAARCR